MGCAHPGHVHTRSRAPSHAHRYPRTWSSHIPASSHARPWKQRPCSRIPSPYSCACRDPITRRYGARLDACRDPITRRHGARLDACQICSVVNHGATERPSLARRPHMGVIVRKHIMLRSRWPFSTHTAWCLLLRRQGWKANVIPVRSKSASNHVTQCKTIH